MLKKKEQTKERTNKRKNKVQKIFELCSGRSRRGASGLFLKNKKAKTSLHKDSFFVRICNIWNALPDNIRAEKELPSFVKKLKSFIYLTLSKVFNQDDIPSFKIVCVKYRFSALNSCTCQSTSFFFFFSVVHDYIFCYFFAWGLVSRLGFNFVYL